MRIHPLSDLHLESGRYGLAPGVECDVILAAGDIFEGVEGVEFLKTLPKPVVYVLGNHEYYSSSGEVDMVDRLAAIRAAAHGSNVHVLEKDAVVIDGVRFLGTTLWTNFGGGHVGLMAAAHGRMNDYQHIGARKWYARRGNREKFLKFYDGKRHLETTQEIIRAGLLDPYIVYQMHCEAVAWLRAELLKEFEGETVVVTHHHPLFESLRRTGVAEMYLTESHLWGRSREDSLVDVAAYASDLASVVSSRSIALWGCGHLHTRLDYMEGGTRVVCNPRGQAIHPYTEAEKLRYALYGYPVSKQAEEDLIERLAEDPYMGYGTGFDRHWVIDLDTGLSDVIGAEAEAVRESLDRLQEEINEFAPLLSEGNLTDKLLVTAVREALEQRAVKFASIFDKLCKHVYENVDGALWSHIPHTVARRLGLPESAGSVHFEAEPFVFPGDSPPPPTEEVYKLTQAVSAAVQSIEILPRVAQAKRTYILARIVLIMEHLGAAGIVARYEPAKGALRPWRRFFNDLGSVLIDPASSSMHEQAREICERVFSRDWPRINREFWLNVVTSDEAYLDEPFDVLYGRGLTLEQLRQAIG